MSEQNTREKQKGVSLVKFTCSIGSLVLLYSNVKHYIQVHGTLFSQNETDIVKEYRYVSSLYSFTYHG